MNYKSKSKSKYVLFIIMFFALDLLIQNIFYLHVSPIIENNITAEKNFIDMSASIIEIIILGLIYLNFFKYDAYINRKSFSINRSFIVALGSSGISYIWIILSTMYLSNLNLINESLEIFEQASASMMDGKYIYSFLAVCIFGPIMEEILFRGLIFRSLEKALKNTTTAIIISGLLFGIWHGIFIQSVYTSIIGITLAYVYSQTKELKWPIIIHFFNNLFSTLPPFIDTEIVNLTLNVLAFLMIIPMIVIIKNLNKNQNKVLYK